MSNPGQTDNAPTLYRPKHSLGFFGPGASARKGVPVGLRLGRGPGGDLVVEHAAAARGRLEGRVEGEVELKFDRGFCMRCLLLL